MILSELRDYLQQHGKVSLADLVNHFGVEADALRGMLNLWINKGYVQKLPLASGCGTQCCQCDPTLTELYQWLTKKP